MPSFSVLWYEAGPAVGAVVAADVGTDLADDVPQPAGHRVLDADDLGPEGRQHARGPGAGELTGEVADPEVVERASMSRRVAHGRGHDVAVP